MTQDAADDGEPVALPRPVLTLALIGLISLVFLAELLLPATRATDTLEPSIATLIAYGGTSGQLVFTQGEWFRLMTAALVHASPAHLALNSLALLVAGGSLELLVGRLWLAALFIIGALGGSLASIHWNPANIVGVGASGAIMALFGALGLLAFRFGPGPARRAFLTNALGALIPSLLPGLLPLAGVSGGQIDYASHAGGAVAGAALGGMMLLLWRGDMARPGAKGLAALVVLAGLGVSGYGGLRLAQGFDAIAYEGRLIPEADLPKTDAAARAAAADLAARFPDDPRGHYYLALRQADDRRPAEAEASARRAVALVDRYSEAFKPGFRARLHGVHALILNDLGRTAEAKSVAAPACSGGSADVQAALRRGRLCP